MKHIDSYGVWMELLVIRLVTLRVRGWGMVENKIIGEKFQVTKRTRNWKKNLYLFENTMTLKSSIEESQELNS